MVSAATMLIALLLIGGLAICVGIVFGAMISSSSPAKASPSLRCNQCGEHNRDNARFCSRCGASLSNSDSPGKP